MEAWLNMDDLKMRIEEEFGRAIELGIEEEAAKIKVAAFLSINRDQLINPSVSIGLVDLILSSRLIARK